MLLRISDSKLETIMTPCKVSWSVPTNSASLRAMVRLALEEPIPPNTAVEAATFKHAVEHAGA